ILVSGFTLIPMRFTMEKPLSLKLFPHSMRMIFLLTVLPFLSYSQHFPLTVPLNQPVIEVYVDRPGDLYVQFENGTIQKFDINGKLVEEIKPELPLALFDPRDGSRAFSFDRKG